MYEDEVIVQLEDGCSLRSGSEELQAGDYVRFCDPDGNEIDYWDKQEWVDDPALIMGAIINIMAGVRPPSMEKRVMNLIVDGEKVDCCNDASMIYEGVVVDYDTDSEEETYANLHVKLTSEGMILDLVDEDGEVIGTYGTEYGEMATLCH
jgi:hypothetical protein